MPDRTGRTRRDIRQALRTQLEQLGLSASLAEACRLVGVQLRQQTIQTKLEYGVLIDAETGVQVADPIPGEEDKVQLTAHFARCVPGRLYVGLHTHPRSLPFSVKDVSLLLRQPFLCAIVAVGRDGTWYVMSVEPGQPRPSLESLRTTVTRHLEALGGEYTTPPYPNPTAARRAHYHAAWERAAPELGLRYDRVEGKQPRE